jgi:hypothetical protein
VNGGQFLIEIASRFGIASRSGLVKKLLDLTVKGLIIHLATDIKRSAYRLDDQVVLLCWRMGEPVIEHWHPTDSGFKDRQPVDERFHRRSASGNRPN